MVQFSGAGSPPAFPDVDDFRFECIHVKQIACDPHHTQKFGEPAVPSRAWYRMRYGGKCFTETPHKTQSGSSNSRLLPKKQLDSYGVEQISCCVGIFDTDNL